MECEQHETIELPIAMLDIGIEFKTYQSSILPRHHPLTSPRHNQLLTLLLKSITQVVSEDATQEYLRPKSKTLTMVGLSLLTFSTFAAEVHTTFVRQERWICTDEPDSYWPNISQYLRAEIM